MVSREKGILTRWGSQTGVSSTYLGAPGSCCRVYFPMRALNPRPKGYKTTLNRDPCDNGFLGGFEVVRGVGKGTKVISDPLICS